MADKVFQIGENIKAYVNIIGVSLVDEACFVTIEGFGPMFDSNEEFIQIYPGNVGDNPVGFDVFENCVSAHRGDLIIPNGITTISKKFNGGIFGGGMRSAIIPTLYIGNSVERIGEQAFASMYSPQYEGRGLKKIISTSKVLKYIEKQAFYNCKNLEEADFNGAPEYIGEWAFSGCYKVRKLNLSTRLEFDGVGFFDECYKLIEFNKGNVINTLPDGWVGRYTNSIEWLTIRDEVNMRQDPFIGYFEVNLGAGSNIDEEGYQITKIYTKNETAINYNWRREDHRTPILVQGDTFLYCAHKGKWVKINGYSSELGNIPISHLGEYKYIRELEGISEAETPLFVAENGVWKQIGY